jgi:hypothetical protein
MTLTLPSPVCGVYRQRPGGGAEGGEDPVFVHEAREAVVIALRATQHPRLHPGKWSTQTASSKNRSNFSCTGIPNRHHIMAFPNGGGWAAAMGAGSVVTRRWVLSDGASGTAHYSAPWDGRSALPPATGWRALRDGVPPAPTLRLDMSGPPEEPPLPAGECGGVRSE